MMLVTAKEMQEMDRRTIEDFGLPGLVLMENAARGAVAHLSDCFGDLSNKRIGIMAGPGNNGGDGFVMARYLLCNGHRTRVYLLAFREKVKGDALANLQLYEKLGGEIVELPDGEAFDARVSEMRHENIWIDALLGTGLNSDVRGHFRSAIQLMNDSPAPVFAVDLPSGLHSDTGAPLGMAVRADATATFAFPKIGHAVYPGVEYTGALKVVDIGIPPMIAAEVAPKQFLLTRERIRTVLSPRAGDAHKGTTGHLLVVGGCPGKSGAAAMSAMSAMRAGAGLVTIGVGETLVPIMDTMAAECMSLPLPDSGTGLLKIDALEKIIEFMEGMKALAMGPGMGTDPGTGELVRKILSASEVPMVIDADGLNNIAGHMNVLKNRKGPVILTPHPGEMSRLNGKSVEEIQKDRIKTARGFAEQYNVHLVLKGAKTVIAHPDGRLFINPTGNPGMASGGMGDVLTGLIAGFLAQGYAPEDAAHIGVYLHGAAADFLSDAMGPFGYIAGDVMESVPAEIKRMFATSR